MTNREQAAARKAQAHDLRIRGFTYRQIGTEMGIGHGTAERWCKEVMDNLSTPLADELRKREYERLERYLKVLDTRIDDGDDRAVTLAVKVSERLCKMMGVDLPTRIEVERTETTQLDLAVQDLISRQAAQNALRLESASHLREAQVVDESGSLSEPPVDHVEAIVLEN